jgi:hypothetical protein
MFKHIDPDTPLDRHQGSAALTARGYPTAPSTLATLASRGGGPVYRKYGSRVRYRWADLLEWAERRTSPPIASTSDLAGRQ